ncbi:MAG: hypothetical protein IT577_05415 [Verrucomicrobiae bacterium]|nr:hypothetical protein [Verrucomicrobiae bacterium]
MALKSLVAGRLAAAFLLPCDGHSIFGRRLRPFCAAHAVALRAIDNPLPWAPSSATLPELVGAAKVCACGSFEELWAIDWRTPDRSDIAAIRRMALSPRAVHRARRRWAGYREDCVVVPELKERAKEGKPCTTPFHLGMVTAVARAFGKDPEWAWFLRYGQLLHYAASLNEGEYGCRWVTEAEEEQIAALEARGITGTKRGTLPEGARVVRRKRRG